MRAPPCGASSRILSARSPVIRRVPVPARATARNACAKQRTHFPTSMPSWAQGASRWCAGAEAAAYYTGNGNGSHGLGPHAAPDWGQETQPYAPTFTAPAAPPVTAGADTSSDYWTPGVFDDYEFGDDPFSTEPPAAVPRAPWV